MKENKLINKVYFDNIVDIEQKNISDGDNLLQLLESSYNDEEYEYLYLDYLPLDILKNYDFSKKEDVRNFYKILYKYKSPVLPMIKFDKKHSVIELREPESEVDERIFYHNGCLIHVDIKNKNNYQDDNDKGKHCFTSMSYGDILEMLMDKSSHFFQYNENNHLETSEISREDFIKKINKEDKKTL